MSAIVRRQINTIRSVVGGDDDTAAIQDAVLAQVLFIDAQHIWRYRDHGFHVIVQREAIIFAEVARLRNAQNCRFQKAVEPAEDLYWCNFEEVPRANRVFDWFERRVLADALIAAENK